MKNLNNFPILYSWEYVKHKDTPKYYILHITKMIITFFLSSNYITIILANTIFCQTFVAYSALKILLT